MKKKMFFKHITYVFILATAVALSAADCVFIDRYDIMQTDEEGRQLNSVKAGSPMTFSVVGHLEPRTTDNNGVTSKLVFAMLAPKDWDVAHQAKVTYKTGYHDDPEEELPMSVIPESQLPKNGEGRTWAQCLTSDYGVGPNVLDDMEWIVFQTDKTWVVRNNEDKPFYIFVRTRAGQRNLKCKLGFFINHTDDGFSGGTDHRKVVFANDCFEVTGGKGMTIDFCNRHFNRLSPLTALQNDYVTISYQADVDPSASSNPLAATDEIYLQGKAVTVSGKTYDAPAIGAQTLMRRQSNLGRSFSLTIWPAGFFNVPTDEIIDHIDYYFSNADGSAIVNQSTDDKVQLGASDGDDTPFNLKLECE